MTKSNLKSALLKAVVIFAVLYLLPHLLFVEFECHDILTIAVSIPVEDKGRKLLVGCIRVCFGV